MLTSNVFGYFGIVVWVVTSIGVGVWVYSAASKWARQIGYVPRLHMDDAVRRNGHRAIDIPSSDRLAEKWRQQALRRQTVLYLTVFAGPIAALDLWLYGYILGVPRSVTAVALFGLSATALMYARLLVFGVEYGNLKPGRFRQLVPHLIWTAALTLLAVGYSWTIGLRPQ